MKKYQITLVNWLTGSEITIILGNTLTEAKKMLKIVRKKYNRMFWLKATPIFC